MDADIVEVITPAFLDHFPRECEHLAALAARTPTCRLSPGPFDEGLAVGIRCRAGDAACRGTGNPGPRRRLGNADAVARHLLAEGDRLMQALEIRAKGGN